MSAPALPTWLDPARFPFSPRPVEVAPGEALSVVDVGQGVPVLMVHGTPTWSYEFRHLLGGLPGYRRVAVDHLGFGLSTRPDGADYRPEAHAERLGRVVDRLGLDTFHLVVHDFGGPIGLEVALARPHQVRSLIAFNTFAWSMLEEPRTARLARLAGTGLFRWLYGAINLSFVISRSAWGDPATIGPHTWTPYLSVFPDAASRRRVLWALARSMAGSSAWMQSIWQRLPALAHLPACLIWGMKDSAFPPWALDRLASAFPRASIHRLASAGHWPHEEQPETCLAAVRSFLAGQAPAASSAAG